MTIIPGTSESDWDPTLMIANTDSTSNSPFYQYSLPTPASPKKVDAKSDEEGAQVDAADSHCSNSLDMSNR
jgi:hypothetical protein